MSTDNSPNDSLDSQNKDNKTYIALFRNETTYELMKDPAAFMLLCQIALRARITNAYNTHGLVYGQALIGDHDNIGLTMKKYRRAKDVLIKGNFISVKRAFNGTVATIINSDIFSITKESRAINSKEKGQSRDNLGATNKKDKKVKKESINRLSIDREISFSKLEYRENKYKGSLADICFDNVVKKYIGKSINSNQLIDPLKDCQIHSLLDFFISRILKDPEEYKTVKDIVIHCINWIRFNLNILPEDAKNNYNLREAKLFYETLDISSEAKYQAELSTYKNGSSIQAPVIKKESTQVFTISEENRKILYNEGDWYREASLIRDINKFYAEIEQIGTVFITEKEVIKAFVSWSSFVNANKLVRELYE